MWWFSSEGFTPRGQCGPWPAWLSCLYQASSLLIALSYLMIPVCLMIFWKRSGGRILHRPWLTPAFSLFIFLCGLTHVCDLLSFHWPAYPLFTLLLSLTALVSVTVALKLPSTVRYFLGLPSPEAYEEAKDKAELEAQKAAWAYAELQRRNKGLSREADAMKEMIEGLRHRQVTDKEYQEMREQLHKIRNT